MCNNLIERIQQLSELLFERTLDVMNNNLIINLQPIKLLSIEPNCSNKIIT